MIPHRPTSTHIGQRRRNPAVENMGSLGGGAAWIVAVCILWALARSNTSLGISSDNASRELERQIVRLQGERNGALSSLTSLRGKLEHCRRSVHACESRAYTGERPVRKPANRKRGACVNVNLSTGKSVFNIQPALSFGVRREEARRSFKQLGTQVTLSK